MNVIDPLQLLRFAAALVFVLALMGGLALIMRRLGQNTPLNGTAKRRLKIIESLPLDSRRRLMIIRRDRKEHLVIIGPNGETLIESGFESPQNGPDETA